VAHAGRDPSTPHLLSLCESKCSTQDDKFKELSICFGPSVHRSHVIRQHEHERQASVVVKLGGPQTVPKTASHRAHVEALA